MNTSTNKPPPNYSSRPMQYRLMMLVGMLMAVILIMFEAAKPSNWEWMWKFEKTSGGAQAESTANAMASGPIDNRLNTREPATPGVPDSFRSEIASDSEFAFGAVSIDDLRPEMFSGIEDDTFFRAEENAAWFMLLDILRQTSIAELQDRSIGEVAFAQLFHQTNDLRGKLVTVTGAIRRAHRVPAAKNELGIKSYWQCWVRPTDGSNSPIVLYTLDLPENVGEGMDIRQSASFTGFCFKRWAYNSASGPRVAPILLAKNVTLRETPQLLDRELASPRVRNIVLGFALVAGLTVGVVAVWATQWKRKQLGDHERQQVAELAAKLGDDKMPTVTDRLRDLETSASPEQASDNH